MSSIQGKFCMRQFSVVTCPNYEFDLRVKNKQLKLYPGDNLRQTPHACRILRPHAPLPWEKPPTYDTCIHYHRKILGCCAVIDRKNGE